MSVTIHQGDALTVLATLPAKSVHCCVTSPPYWGLRDYGTEGQLGLEPTPEEYIARMVAVFREVRRVLRSDGTCWVNMGDSYAGSWGAQSRPNGSDIKSTLDGGSMLSARQIEAAPRETCTGSLKNTPGMKAKDLCGIPWMLAFALRADGWYLRSDIIWAKPNPMPESVTDRPTKSHEYLFLLSKSQTYYYDAEAIAEPANGWNGSSFTSAQDYATKPNLGLGERNETSSRNKRTVWTVATQPTPDAHFATFPEELIKPCILAGTSERGCCSRCGAQWERQTEREKPPDEVFTKRNAPDDGMVYSGSIHNGEWKGHGQKLQNWLNEHPAKTTGWQATCTCDAPVTRCTVLDPFFGSGTTALVARMNGCHAIGIELNPAYIKIAERRLAQDVLEFTA